MKYLFVSYNLIIFNHFFLTSEEKFSSMKTDKILNQYFTKRCYKSWQKL